MKTLGLIGGLSWFSTSVYYKTINQLINAKLGDSHSAKLVLFSVDFEEFKKLQEKNDWDQLEIMITDIALKLQNAGADCLVMCTNTPHLIADKIKTKIKIPLIHIAEETGKEIKKHNINKVALLGTKFTMENSFFKDPLKYYGIDVIIPDEEDRNFIHKTIFSELTKGIFSDNTKLRYLDIINKLSKDGIQGVVLGCTEIGLLLDPKDCNVILFDTTAIHSKAVVDFALSERILKE